MQSTWSFTPPYNLVEIASIACAWLIYVCVRQVR